LQDLDQKINLIKKDKDNSILTGLLLIQKKQLK